MITILPFHAGLIFCGAAGWVDRGFPDKKVPDACTEECRIMFCSDDIGWLIFTWFLNP